MTAPNSPQLRAVPRLRTSHSTSTFHPPPADPTVASKAAKYTRVVALATGLGITLLAVILHLHLQQDAAPAILRAPLPSYLTATLPSTPTLAAPPPTPRSWLSRYRYYAPRKALATPPVRVALMTPHFFGDGYAGTVAGCTYQGQPLTCTYYEPTTAADAVPADVLWYHAPAMCDAEADVSKFRRQQLTAVVSMESAGYYPCLDSVDYMRKFDVEMTYRMCSQVPVHYLVSDLAHPPSLQRPPLPFEHKLDAVAFVNSNCEPLSPRQRVVDAYLALNASVPLHSYGACANNMGAAAVDKLAVFRRYKFCICMENSVAADYVTEKVWHGLAAGCVPIYLGAPNVLDFVPEREAIIDFARVGSVQALAALLGTLVRDRAAYERMLAWKRRPLGELSAGFRHLLARSEHVLQHSQCQLCQLAAAHRSRPARYTTCLFNATWAARAQNRSHGGR